MTWLLLLGFATMVDGLLAGASLDQSIEQLPARHRIGIGEYSAYSRAAHRGNGRFWLVPLGLGGAGLTIAVAIWGLMSSPTAGQAVPLVLAAGLAIAHTASTAIAAPLNMRQWHPGLDEAGIASILDRFERWQALRAALQFLTFVVMIWALLSRIAVGAAG